MKFPFVLGIDISKPMTGHFGYVNTKLGIANPHMGPYWMGYVLVGLD